MERIESCVICGEPLSVDRVMNGISICDECEELSTTEGECYDKED